MVGTGIKGDILSSHSHLYETCDKPFIVTYMKPGMHGLLPRPKACILFFYIFSGIRVVQRGKKTPESVFFSNLRGIFPSIPPRVILLMVNSQCSLKSCAFNVFFVDI